MPYDGVALPAIRTRLIRMGFYYCVRFVAVACAVLWKLQLAHSGGAPHQGLVSVVIPRGASDTPLSYIIPSKGII